MSRLQQAHKAVRPALQGRMMLSGPSGAGKTRSGLIVCTVLADGEPILGVDTEKESMLTYADDFDFTHLAWSPPYDPRELVELLKEAGGQYGVIFVDSASHFWRKEGGVLDIANGKFTGWKEARPVQEEMVDAILNCPAHVVLGVRSKVEHTQELENGKNVVKKLGMAAQQDDDLEFEMNVAIEMSMDHTATISKSRTTVLPVGRAFKGGQIESMAAVYRDWLRGGEPLAATPVWQALKNRMDNLDPAVRKAVKDEFVATFGRPDHLRDSQVDAATRFVDDKVYEIAHPSGEAEAEAEAKPVRQWTDAQRIHIEAGRLKISEEALDVIILNCTKGRTQSAKELDGGETGRVRIAMQQWADGTLDQNAVRLAVGEYLNREPVA